MSFLKRVYPFNAEQTVNILSEFGPLVTMFVVNAAAGINAGTWALIAATILAMIVMRLVLGRFPIFPIIASSVTIAFGVLTLVTKDPMWVQIKVSIFNALFGGFLFGGLFATSPVMSRPSLLTVLGLLVVGGGLQAPLVMSAHGDIWAPTRACGKSAVRQHNVPRFAVGRVPRRHAVQAGISSVMFSRRRSTTPRRDGTASRSASPGSSSSRLS